MEQPTELTPVKVIHYGLLTSEVFAVDDKGNVWRRIEGIGEDAWKLFKRVEEFGV
jgi:hypothetical protein